MMTSPDSDLLNNLSLEVRSDRPLYAQLVDHLRVLVDTHFGDGDLFYSEKTLLERLPVSQITIQRALRELTAEGLLVPGRGRGTTIRKKARLDAPVPTRPSLSAGRTAKRQERLAKKILGIFLPQRLLSASEHSLALMSEFQRQGDVQGIEVRFHDTSDTTRLSQIFRSVSGNPEEEAFVFHTPSDLTHLLYHALANRGYRSVAMEGIGPDYPGQVVATNSAAAVQIGLDYLQSLGHSRVVLLVNEPASEFNVQDKIHAFEQGIQERGIASSCRVVLCDNFVGGDSYEAAYAHMAEVVQGGPSRPTAIFTVSDPGAWAVLKWCSQHKIPVPDEISVLGFENSRSSQYMIPGVSSVAHPDVQLVETAYDVLWGTKGNQFHQLLIAPTLVIRESTASPPRNRDIPPL